MLYRLYYDPDLYDDPDTVRRYSETLLGHAFLQEKQLSYHDQTIIRSKWGKPALQDHPQIHYNVSHCKGLISCILADVPVGIDVEYVRPYSPYAAKHALSRQELDDLERAEDPDRQFFRYWTLKESCVKAIGIGLSYSLKRVTFRIKKNDIQSLDQPRYRFILLEDTGPYITAVCYREAGESVRIFESA